MSKIRLSKQEAEVHRLNVTNKRQADVIVELQNQKRALQDKLGAIIGDIEVMRTQKPTDFYENEESWNEHWFGGFSAWGKETDAYDNDNAVIQWPNLSILVKEAKALIKS